MFCSWLVFFLLFSILFVCIDDSCFIELFILFSIIFPSDLSFNYNFILGDSLLYHVSYTVKSHLTHLNLMNSHLTTLLKFYPTSNLTIQNSDLMAVIPGTWD